MIKACPCNCRFVLIRSSELRASDWSRNGVIMIACPRSALAYQPRLQSQPCCHIELQPSLLKCSLPGSPPRLVQKAPRRWQNRLITVVRASQAGENCSRGSESVEETSPSFMTRRSACVTFNAAVLAACLGPVSSSIASPLSSEDAFQAMDQRAGGSIGEEGSAGPYIRSHERHVVITGGNSGGFLTCDKYWHLGYMVNSAESLRFSSSFAEKKRLMKQHPATLLTIEKKVTPVLLGFSSRFASCLSTGFCSCGLCSLVRVRTRIHNQIQKKIPC